MEISLISDRRDKASQSRHYCNKKTANGNAGAALESRNGKKLLTNIGLIFVREEKFSFCLSNNTKAIIPDHLGETGIILFPNVCSFFLFITKVLKIEIDRTTCIQVIC